MAMPGESAHGDLDGWLEPDEDAPGGVTQTPSEALKHRQPGLAAGMALCIPSLSLMGLLYTLLK